MKYKISKDIILQKIDKDLIGFDTNKSFLYTFNETALFIFSKLRRKTSEEEIIRALIKKYEVNEKQAKNDVDLLLKQLLKKRIIFLA